MPVSRLCHITASLFRKQLTEAIGLSQMAPCRTSRRGFALVTLVFLILSMSICCNSNTPPSFALEPDQSDGLCMGSSKPSESIYDVPYNLARAESERKASRNVFMILMPEFGTLFEGKECTLECSRLTPNTIINFIAMLDNFYMDDYMTDIVLFHEGYPYASQMKEIRVSTPREIDFVNVDSVFLRPHGGMDMYTNDPNWGKRSKWRYHMMIRFMVQDVFRFPVMDNVDYYMRLDLDSCFRDETPDLFPFMRAGATPAVYMANKILLEDPKLPSQRKVGSLTLNYLRENNIVPKQMDMWVGAFPDDSIRLYYNNFEIGSVAFFRRPDVQAYADMLVNSGGIFKYRWGDAGIRYLTMAIYAHEHEVLHLEDFGVNYLHPCVMCANSPFKCKKGANPVHWDGNILKELEESASTS